MRLPALRTTRSATSVRTCTTWDHAMWSAVYEATENGVRCYVFRCSSSTSEPLWHVWRLNDQAVGSRR